MKKGQIIRRMLNDGTPVGAYMCIIEVTRTHVIAQLISHISNDKKDAILLTKSHVHVVRLQKIIVSEEIWERIDRGWQQSIIHDTTPVWNKMADKEPEVVQLKKFNYPNKIMFFSIDQIRDVWYNRQRQIRLDLGERIL